MDTPVERENEAQGNPPPHTANTPHPRHREAQFRRLAHVHLVNPRALQRDRLHAAIVQQLQDLRAEHIVHESANRLVPLGKDRRPRI